MTTQKMLLTSGHEAENECDFEELGTYNELLRSKAKHVILTGVIDRCTVNKNATTEESKIIAVIEYSGFRVVVPASKLGIQLEEEVSDQRRITQYKNIITSMIGAEVDFVVLGVDRDNKVAVASRAKAMAMKQEHYYFKTQGKDGLSKLEARFKSQCLVQARIIGLSASSVRVELFGVDVRVPVRDVSHRFISFDDLRQEYAVGKAIPVLITHLEVNREDRQIDIRVSIKDATKDLKHENIKRYAVDSTVKGVVTNIGPNGYFIAVGDHVNGIDVYCSMTSCFELPNIGDEVVCEIGIIDEERARVFGKIVKILRKRVD